MRRDSGRQEDERVELLKLTGPRDGQQTFTGAFTMVASRPEHDLPPLNSRAEGSAEIVVRLNARLVHEERKGPSALAAVRCRSLRADSRFSICSTFAISSARVRGETAGIRVAAEATPSPKEAATERERLPAEAFRGGRGGEVERTEHVAGHMCPLQLALPTTSFRYAGSRSLPRMPANAAPNTICNTSEPRDTAMR